MSNRLTFSLASLVLIMAVALCFPVGAAEINGNAAVSIPTEVVVPAKGFAIIARVGALDATAEVSGTSNGIRAGDDLDILGDNYRVATGMPDLARFFAVGGTITLLGNKARAADANASPAVDALPAAVAKSVVISEIMWARDGTGASADKQWIELYNTTGADITVTLPDAAFASNSHWALVFTPQRPVAATGDGLSGSVDTGGTAKVPDRDDMIIVDQVSNISVSPWSIEGRGQSGMTIVTTPAVATPVISMYRTIDYAKVEEGDSTKKADRDKQLADFPDGHKGSSWKQSNAINVFEPAHIGTPGAKHFKSVAAHGETKVPRESVVITEVGNSSDDKYDWIELTALKNQNLKDYELQVVYNDDKDARQIMVLAQFEDRVLEKDKILLVLQSDPTKDDHPIAAGRKWGVAEADRDKTGTDSVYWIDSKLKIPNAAGKMLFILREAKDKKDHDKIVDLAGNLFITDLSADYSTNLWPLREAAAGNGNVIKDEDENFDDRTQSYQRDDRGSGIGENDWSVRGYTGIGYKRRISDLGGTPGFDNGSLKEKSSDLTDASVSISEIMYQTGRNLPQWIELYNSSKTQAVNLNGWKLKIENYDDDDVDIRTPAVTIQFGATIIPPNQPVLIVSKTGGQISRDVDVDHRVIGLYDTKSIRDDLEATDRRPQVLSTMAFKLTLMQKDHKDGDDPVDVAGNLDADGTAMWTLPAEDADGRSSIIRRYNIGPVPSDGKNRGMAQDGTMPVWSGAGGLGDAGGLGNAGWVLASASDREYQNTYYGHRDDIGTPGFRAGGALPASLSKFRPERMKDTGQIVVRWVTESELNNAGFNILRSEKRDGEFTKLNTKLIAGQGTTSERTAYEYADTSAKPNVVYYYQIQDVSLEGQVTTLRTTHLRGNVSAAGKLTTTWGELKALQ